MGTEYYLVKMVESKPLFNLGKHWNMWHPLPLKFHMNPDGDQMFFLSSSDLTLGILMGKPHQNCVLELVRQIQEFAGDSMVKFMSEEDEDFDPLNEADGVISHITVVDVADIDCT